MNTIDPAAYYDQEQARELFPRPPHRATLWRWMLKGVGSGANHRRLESLKVGHARFITGQAILDFVNWKPPEEKRVIVRSPAERNRAAEAAARELKRLGV